MSKLPRQMKTNDLEKIFPFSTLALVYSEYREHTISVFNFNRLFSNDIFLRIEFNHVTNYCLDFLIRTVWAHCLQKQEYH